MEVVDDNFTNDSAMMIAHERALESTRSDALFQDPFAKSLAGSKGERLSDSFGQGCMMFELPEWPEFHKMWTAVRTKFIDDHVSSAASTSEFHHFVNLGAGMDTRPYRLECYSSFAGGSFAVDMEVINKSKAAVFKDFLGDPKPFCSVEDITLDFLDVDKTLATELGEKFDATKKSLFLAEGLIMYLGAVGKVKLLKDVSAVAAPGSVFILQFMDASESKSKDDPAAVAAALSAAEATSILTENNWGELQFFKFGDEKLNFGRYPTDRFKSCAAFSFLLATKLAS